MINPQKCLLYNNIALPLQDFPEGILPQSGDKCLLIRDKNLCIPVYNRTIVEMPTDGLVYYIAFDENRENAESGQPIVKTGNFSFVLFEGIPCAKLETYSNFYIQDIGENTYPKTFSFWTATMSISTTRVDLGFHNADENGTTIFINGNETLDVVEQFVNYAISDLSIENPQMFHHYCVTVEASTIKVYVDGVLKESKAYSMTNKTKTRFGVESRLYDESSSITPSFIYISALRLYNRILDDNEILSLSKEFVPSFIVPEMPTDGLIFYAALSEEKSTAETGQSLESHGVNYLTMDTIPCAYLDGHSYIKAPFGMITGNMPRTMTAWMKTPKDNSWKVGFYFGEESSYKNFWIGQGGDGTLSAYGYEVDVIGPENDGKWHNLCATYDGSVFKLYVDGTEFNSVTFNLNTTSSDLFIGCTVKIDNFFKGYIAACRIYNRAISESEVQLLANEFTPNLEE